MATAPTPQPVRRTAAAPATKPADPEPEQAESEDPFVSAPETEDPFAHADAEASGDIDEDLDDVLDLSDVEAIAGREVLPSGTYDAFVKTAEWKRSKKGNKMFALQALIRRPDSEEYNFPLFMNLTFTGDRGVDGRSKHQVNIITDGQVDWRSFKGSVVADQLVGQYFRVKLTQKNDAEYGLQNNVRDVLPPADAMGGFAD
jgi:hypothetical protein